MIAPVAPKPLLRGRSHGVAFAVAIVLGGALVFAAPAGLPRIAVTIYALALVGMFGASALYHLPDWSPGRTRRMLQVDHTAIFCMIAGTATPIALLATSGVLRGVLLVLVWAVAAAGIAFEWSPVPAPQGYVTAVYPALGWIGVIGLGGLWSTTGWLGVALAVTGGLLYTVGAAVHAGRRPDPWPRVFGYHEIFHGFVILAALCHYCLIALVLVPTTG